MAIRSSALDRFLSAIHTQNDDEAEALVQALGVDVAGELAALTCSDDLNERWWSVRALAECGDGASAAIVAERTHDPDPGVRAVAALAVGHLHARYPDAVAAEIPIVARLLSDRDGLVRQSAVESLTMCGDAAIPALIYILTESHQGARTRATSALRKIGTMAVARVLFGLLNDDNYLVRMYAHEGLDEMGLLETVLVTL